MIKRLGPILIVSVVVALAAVVGWKVHHASQGSRARKGDKDLVVAVEVAPITSGRIREMRVFAGTLEASARFRAAAKVGGLIKSVEVDLGDEVDRDQIVARLDDAELVQGVLRAEGELAVANAQQASAQSDLKLAQIELDRAQKLHEGGLIPAAQLDGARAALESAKSAVHLAGGQVRRAAAALEVARIQLGHTEVRASWSGQEKTATVALRHQDAGSTVQAGAPIVDIVKLHPLVGVMTVPERDYASLSVGQEATISTDSAPGASFPATITRIAPVFSEASRQARVELRVDNPEGRLKPGAFARFQLVLRSVDADLIVPSAAVTRRKDRDVIFVVVDGSQTVSMRPVQTGLVEGDRVQITPVGGGHLSGDVVVLGQQLLDDASAVRVVDRSLTAEGDAEPGG